VDPDGRVGTILTSSRSRFRDALCRKSTSAVIVLNFIEFCIRIWAEIYFFNYVNIIMLDLVHFMEYMWYIQRSKSYLLSYLRFVGCQYTITVVAHFKAICLPPFERWDRGFESHSGHGCLCAFILCLCCPVCRQRPCLGLIPRPRSPADCLRLRTWSETSFPRMPYAPSGSNWNRWMDRWTDGLTSIIILL
jgi:hypothetical protein